MALIFTNVWVSCKEEEGAVATAPSKQVLNNSIGI